MFDLPGPKTETNLPAKMRAKSSTEFVNSADSKRLLSRARPRYEIRLSGEVRLLPKAWRAEPSRGRFSLPVEALGERKESVFGAVSLLEIPNRKERLKSSFPPLLIPANSSEIGIFADQQQHQNAAADEMVMDRGAECIAGGCDVI